MLRVWWSRYACGGVGTGQSYGLYAPICFAYVVKKMLSSFLSLVTSCIICVVVPHLLPPLGVFFLSYILSRCVWLMLGNSLCLVVLSPQRVLRRVPALSNPPTRRCPPRCRRRVPMMGWRRWQSGIPVPLLIRCHRPAMEGWLGPGCADVYGGVARRPFRRIDPFAHDGAWCIPGDGASERAGPFQISPAGPARGDSGSGRSVSRIPAAGGPVRARSSGSVLGLAGAVSRYQRGCLRYREAKARERAYWSAQFAV